MIADKLNIEDRIYNPTNNQYSLLSRTIKKISNIAINVY